MNEVMAISLLKAYVDLYRKVDIDKRYLTKQGLECIETVLDLVEKQTEKIKELEKPKYILNAETNEIKEIPMDNNYISKDKIKSKIREIDGRGTFDAEIILLKLLEEN